MKFFIYNGQGTSPQCVHDTERLCQGIAKSEVRVSGFTENLDGAMTGKPCVLVVPGGASTPILHSLNRDGVWDIKGLYEKGYGYLGICAGAYIAPKRNNLFYIDETYSMPQELFTDRTLGLDHLGIVYGPFYPTPDQHNIKIPRPGFDAYVHSHIVDTDSLSFKQQVYIDGCGFTNLPSDVESIGQYIKPFGYKFTINKKPLFVPELSFAVTKKASGNKGPVLLTGTHIESSVENSELGQFIKPESIESGYGARYSRFFSNRAHYEEQAKSLIIYTLGRS